MRVLVCGGRDYKHSAFVYTVLNSLEITHLIEGGARGADDIAHGWAHDTDTPHTTVRADWKTHGKKAGILRNIRMLEEYRPDLVIAFPGGRGTAHMVEIARKAGVEVKTY